MFRFILFWAKTTQVGSDTQASSFGQKRSFFDKKARCTFIEWLLFIRRLFVFIEINHSQRLYKKGPITEEKLDLGQDIFENVQKCFNQSICLSNFDPH